jgi:rod shape-determining protein MreC
VPIDLVRILLFKDFTDLAAQKALQASKMPPLTDVPPPVASSSVLPPALTAKPAAAPVVAPVVPKPLAGKPVVTKPAPAKPIAPTPAPAKPVAKPSTAAAEPVR